MIISYCVPCMNRTYDLKKTLPLAIQAADASPPVEIVVLDYNSKDDLEDYMLDYRYMVTYKKYTGREHYHMAHAQNLAMLSGSGDYLVNAAADMVLSINFFAVIRQLLSSGDVVWMSSSKYGWPVIRKDEFIDAGGFDERMEYYGKNDRDIIGRLRRRGGKHVAYPNSILTIIPTPKPDKFKNYSLKSAHRMKVLNRDIYDENMKNEVLTVNPDGWGSWNETCHWCGQRKGVIHGLDPYAVELELTKESEENEEEEWWCDECYQDRLDEI